METEELMQLLAARVQGIRDQVDTMSTSRTLDNMLLVGGECWCSLRRTFQGRLHNELNNENISYKGHATLDHGMEYLNG